jgi:hypothetical protein
MTVVCVTIVGVVAVVTGVILSDQQHGGGMSADPAES